MTTNIPFRALRQKRMGQRTFTFMFTWEGGEYIEVAFEHCIPHDVINTYGGDGTNVPFTAAGFRGAVKDYLRGLDREVTYEYWGNRRVAS